MDVDLAAPKADLDQSHGAFFSPNQRITAWVIALGGAVLIVCGYILIPLGILMLAGGSYAALTKSGAQIDFTKALGRSYTHWWGLFKRGNWQDLDRFVHISILQKRVKAAMEARYTPRMEEEFQQCEVVLLSKNHRRRFLVSVFKNYEEAKKEALELSEKLGKPLVKYNPEISSATQTRKITSRRR